MAWRWQGGKPLSEPMVVRLLMHICVMQPQWVNCIEMAIILYLHEWRRKVKWSCSTVDWAEWAPSGWLVNWDRGLHSPPTAADDDTAPHDDPTGMSCYPARGLKKCHTVQGSVLLHFSQPTGNSTLEEIIFRSHQNSNTVIITKFYIVM